MQKLEQGISRSDSVDTQQSIHPVELFYSRKYVTDKGTLIKAKPWTEEWSRADPSDPKEYIENIYPSQKQLKIWIRSIGEKADIKAYLDHPRSNCHNHTFDGTEGGYFMPEDVINIVRDNDYRPVAGWSKNGDHPNAKWNQRKGFGPIIGSTDFIIGNLGNSEDRSPEEICNEDIVIYWAKNEKGEWLLTHSGFFSDISKAKPIDSQWGPHVVCDHDISGTLSEYGTACTIYHTDRQNGRHVKQTGVEIAGEMRMLLDNKCHVIADSNSTPREKPQQRDIIVYWTYNDHTKQWFLAHSATISRVAEDGQVYASSRSLRDGKDREHVASVPGFPYKNWVIYRVEDSSGNEADN